ncbi:hypothetical protein PpBr36_00381 [Pyricularia pennisetigena]|uniref:hypothetical protein n=1 Tax=Pyricularia pennisetigena TaxID=1578925 RepID=UPI00115084C3|nr:hypothetical protein PpBr36_00381 [Pyricularia pennisetigena]TLS28559.1 hypothetical protein PpBr36_00381 [Pyricularia pennisetigena]
MLEPTDLNGCALMSDFVLIGVHGTTQRVWQCGAPMQVKRITPPPPFPKRLFVYCHKVPYDLKPSPQRRRLPLASWLFPGLPDSRLGKETSCQCWIKTARSHRFEMDEVRRGLALDRRTLMIGRPIFPGPFERRKTVDI